MLGLQQTKNHLKSTALILLSFLFLIACNSEKEVGDAAQNSPRIKKQTKLVSPKINAEYVLGDVVAFKLESETPVDSIVLEYEGKESVYLDKEFNWTAELGKTGVQKLKVNVYCQGLSETHYPKIIFFSDVSPSRMGYQVLQTLPHDPTAYTQGLFFLEDTLVESTGQKGESRLSKINLKTAQVYSSTSLASQYFGEGSTIWKDQIYQLTWTSHTGFVYDLNLKQKQTFSYPHEGWGITTFGDTLIVSDGTETLHLIDPRDFSEVGKLEVYTDESKVMNLNELEMIDGILYANVWLEEVIVSIDPKSGKVLSVIEMSGLDDRFESDDAEAYNGIAYHAGRKEIYVTGKLWPNLFQVKFIPKN